MTNRWRYVRKIPDFSLPCPECAERVKVWMSPRVSGTSWEPEDAPAIEDLDGACEHLDDLMESEKFYDLCLAEAVAQAQQDYDDEMDARFERERDRWLENHDPDWRSKDESA